MPSDVDQPTASFARSELQQAAPKSSISSSLKSLVSRHQHSDQQGLPSSPVTPAITASHISGLVSHHRFAANHTTPHHTTPHYKRPFPLSLAQTCSTTLVHSVAACSLRRVSSLTTDIDPFEKGGMAAHLMQASTLTPAADQLNYNPTKDRHLHIVMPGALALPIIITTFGPETLKSLMQAASGFIGHVRDRLTPPTPRTINHFVRMLFGGRNYPASNHFTYERSASLFDSREPRPPSRASGQSRTEIERLSETALLVRPCRPSLSKICLPGQGHPAGAAAKGPGTWHFHGYLHTRNDLRFASSAHQPYLPRHPCKNAQNLRGKIYGLRAISKGKYPDATLSENTAGSQRRSML
ncbi:hypothetical protein CH63R_13705 [Colletotrichum higginsianum IMI 349063]|uniref:Uncharacterized protein n=1 Tax=Colletotrichum higginsianum (strain IMI 349063) TaxID=759273 RepID=A0A1B7XRU4_COLHI|nr:hypothetical protein CH63R_13705 [Colletotrichum higginsianum IMI 349063]OBR02479.1 hypothetical protein CH63R_13705 [Colletotrichum higginsianum IMI 349063]